MKRVYDNERGVALVLALILSVIVLATISALVYLMTQGTMMSGYQKRYETSLEGAKGGVDIVTKEIIPQAIGQVSASALSTLESTLKNTYNVSSPFPLTLNFPFATSSCLLTKLTKTTLELSTNNWTAAGCSADMVSTYLKNPTTGAVISDVSFVLPGPTTQQNFVVYAKIVDTVSGNTSTSGLDLQGGGVVESGSGMVSPKQVPYMYRIEVQAERQNNPDEHSNLSVLYGY